MCPYAKHVWAAGFVRSWFNFLRRFWVGFWVQFWVRFKRRFRTFHLFYIVSPSNGAKNGIQNRIQKIIRTLLAGGRTTKAKHSAIRILLGRNANTSHQNTISGREDHQRGTQCHQNAISGREDQPGGTQCHQNTISGRRDDDSRTQCHQNTISGREDHQRGTCFFFLSAPVAFRRVALDTPEWTSKESNHHRQSVSAGKTNTIPTESSGRLNQRGT